MVSILILCYDAFVTPRNAISSLLRPRILQKKSVEHDPPSERLQMLCFFIISLFLLVIFIILDVQLFGVAE